MAARRRVPEATNPGPSPYRTRSGDTRPESIVPGFAADRDFPPERPRRGRLRGRIRRIVGVLCALAFLAVIVFGALLLITPSARQAQAIVRARDHVYGVAYPGPPVPARFAAALVATEDHRFYSDPGVDPVAAGRVAVGYISGHGSQQGGGDAGRPGAGAVRLRSGEPPGPGPGARAARAQQAGRRRGAQPVAG